MDIALDEHSVVTLGVWLLLQILTLPQAVAIPPCALEEEDADDGFSEILLNVGEPVQDPMTSFRSTLQYFRLSTSLPVLRDDLRFWIKPRSTTWFSRFLMAEYDDARWLQMFRMTKGTVFALADVLTPHVRKKDTRYRVAIPVVIRVACTLFKLTHGASLFICSEMFAIGKSTVCSIIRDVVHAVNETLRHNISWPTGDRLWLTQQKFADLCSLPAIVGAIDGMHVSIAKSCHVPADYYYFKSGGYTLNCQAVVDSEKRFLDLYLGMPGSTNDSRVLRRSSLYDLAMHNNFFNNEDGVEGFSPYLIGDQGYLLLPWLMVPHRSNMRLSMAEALFNRKLWKGRCVVENAFGIMKQTFRELLTKSDLDMAFLPDVILCCAILHNMLLGQSHEEVQNLFEILRNEGLDGEMMDDCIGGSHAPENPDDGEANGAGEGMHDSADTAAAMEKRALLGVHLSQQRQ